ncbi:MAG: molecular chaperone [Pseudomonadota bacterium]|nr:molecular chaperone [Pseudomonadota bacterium]
MLFSPVLQASPIAAENAPAAAAAEPTGTGDLLVAPTRVVLEGRTRAAEVTLSNKAAKEATYRISFTHLRMDENGKYTEISEEAAKKDPLSADAMLRYSPHQVTLKPGESQTVKVMARPVQGLADGEYTSHLLFRAVPDVSAGQDVEMKTVQQGQLSVRLIPVYGVSIPVIVRQGTVSAQAKLSNAALSGKNLTVTINRSGNKSVYGDVIVTDASGNVAGQARGVAVLVPNAKRNVQVPLNAGAAGNLTIEYREREEEGGKILDKVTLKSS